jgi:TonB-linked SusC/RagA family outer membrane protein
VDGSFGENTEWNPDIIMGGGIQSFQSTLIKGSSYGYSPLIENYLTYSNIVGKHDFSAMIGNSWKDHTSNGTLKVRGSNFDDYKVKNIFFANNSSITEQTYGVYAYLSYFGRINYQFDGRYLLTANLRADGSPKFAPSNRWGYFPSVALAWKLHEENWMKRLNLFDQFKLRAGWGVSGNDAIDDFMYLAKVWNINVFYPLGVNEDKAPGATVARNAASNIKWESTVSRTVGIDFALLQNRFTGTVEYFDKNTNDILFGVPIPPSMGYGTNLTSGNPIVNAASVKNEGVELLLGFRDRAGEFNYSVNANYTYVHNEVTSLGAGQPYMYGTATASGSSVFARTDIGHPIGYFYGFVADGVFRTQVELDAANAAARAKGHEYYQMTETKPGDVRYKDLDGDGYVNWENDRTELGSAIPKHYFGLSAMFSYKAFDLNVDLQGIAGSWLYDGFHTFRSGASLGNKDAIMLDRWRSEQQPGNGIQPRAVIGDPAQNDRPSTLLIDRADYLKIRQLSIGYTLPKSLVDRIGFENIRLYCSTWNLYTFTGYSIGYDPDIAGWNNNNLGRGIDFIGTTPNPRTLVFGLQFGL